MISFGMCVCVCVCACVCVTTGCAILCQGTGGTLCGHTMVGRHNKSVLLQVLGPAPGVCLVLAQKFPEVHLGGGGRGRDVTTCGSSLHLSICTLCPWLWCSVHVGKDNLWTDICRRKGNVAQALSFLKLQCQLS